MIKKDGKSVWPIASQSYIRDLNRIVESFYKQLRGYTTQRATVLASQVKVFLNKW